MEQPEWLKIGFGGVVPVAWDDIAAKDVGAEAGSLTGWASVYNVVDLQGDVVRPGAFTKTLKEWRASKRVIAVTADHQNTADGVVGSITRAEDTSFGLRIGATFSATPRAQEVRQKAVEGHLNGLSIWGPIYTKSFETRDGAEVRILHEVGLMTVGLSPVPANMSSMLISAKAVVDKPWDGSSARFSIEQWRASCLVDTGKGETSEFGRYKVPVKEPNGDISRAAVHTAAGGHGLMAVEGVSPDVMKAAARKLITIYKNDLKEDPPESMMRMAGMAAASLPQTWVADMRSALSISVPQAQKAAVDVLVGSRYGLMLDEPAPDPVSDPTDPEAPLGDGPDAAKYALGLIGESGPSGASPGGEPRDSLADLMASIDGAKVSADLDALAAEIEQAGRT